MKRKAASLGLRVEFARKLFGPRHVQNRIYINGHRCQLATQVRPLEDAAQPPVVLSIPASTWANFVILVPPPICGARVPPPGQNEPFFVVPRAVLQSTNLQTAGQLLKYADRWSLLAKSGLGSGTAEYETLPSRSAEQQTSL
ncbi:MAG TPA: hypothetical protein VIY69_03515 [Candidatus Acidoferrales bacterium]